MIDWLSYSLPYHGPVVGDQYLRLNNKTGIIEPVFHRGTSARGSFDDRVLVHVLGREMRISGNIVKFLTGQNVVGTDDIQLLARLGYEAILRALELPDCTSARRALNSGNVPLTRVDCTFHYHVGTEDDVRNWLRAMEQACTVTYRGRGQYDDGMTSWLVGGKGSRRWSFKFYCKSIELRRHPMRCPQQFRDLLTQRADGVVRGEATFRGQELKRLGFQYLRSWSKESSYELHKSLIDKMEISEQVEMKPNEEKALPRPLQSTYRHWLNGVDCRDLLTRTTFYKHRRELKSYGIDIREVCPKAENRIIPVLRVIEAEPVNREDDEQVFHQLLKAA